MMPDTSSAGRSEVAFGTWVEFISSWEDGGTFFGSVRLLLPEPVSINIGLDRLSFSAFQRIQSLRPFDDLPGVEHRAFFTGRMGGKTDSTIKLQVRVELGDRGCSVDVTVPHSLAGNLKWLYRVRDPAEVAHLMSSEPEFPRV
jgi:hypothetical protein